MSKIINFARTHHKSRIKAIAEAWGDKHLTVKQAAELMGMPARSLHSYIPHLREAGSLEEVGRTGGKSICPSIVWRHTGIYSPPADGAADDLDDGPVRRVSAVKPFRDDLCRAFFGDARISG